MSRPLENHTILITRSRDQAPEFRQLLEQAGARVLELPTIEIRPRPNSQLDRVVEGLEHCDWLMFTSANAVEIVMDRARALGRLPGEKGNSPVPKICTIGPATARKVESYGYSVDLVPRLYQAEGVLEDFLRMNQGEIKGLRILLPRASEAREVLPQTLREQGAEVNLIAVYDTVIPDRSRAQLAELLSNQPPDMITFTSSSTVKNFVALAQGVENLKEFCCAVIGPITAATAAEYGFNTVVQPEKSSVPDLVRAIGQYFQQLKG